MSGRERMLGAIRGALRDVAPVGVGPDDPGDPVAWSPDGDPDPAAAYARRSGLTAAERAELFAARAGEYRATVTRCGAEDAAIARAVGAACARHAARVLAVAPGLAPAWLPAGLELRRDDSPLSAAELDACDGAITGAAGAIAQTGTIVLDGGPGQGRRALTLVPDLHVCVVRAETIAGGVPEAIAALGEPIRARRAPITLISGPSATSDIELERVEGVHGPRRLEIVLAG